MDANISALVNNIREDIHQLNYDMEHLNTYYLDEFTENKNIDNILMSAEPSKLLDKINEVLDLHSTIMSRKQKIRDLLRYHMNNKNIKNSIDNIQDAAQLTKTILDTYHYKAGGYNFEDCGWNMHTSTSKLFKIDDMSVVFSNSIREELLNDTESLKFLINIINFIERQLSSNLKINWKKKYDENREMWWILITIKNKD